MTTAKPPSSSFPFRTSANLSARTLTVEVQPPPTSFAERRAVLLALQQTGPIDVFRKLQHRYRFLVVAKHPDTADKLVRESPRQYSAVIPSAVDGGESNPAQAQMPLWGVPLKPSVFAVPVKKDAASPTKPNPSPSPLSVDTRSFSVAVSHRPDYLHYAAVEKPPAHAFVAPDEQALESNGVLGNALQKVVPAGVAARGLANWGMNNDDQSNRSIDTARRAAKIRRAWERLNLFPGAMLGLVRTDSDDDGGSESLHFRPS